MMGHRALARASFEIGTLSAPLMRFRTIPTERTRTQEFGLGVDFELWDLEKLVWEDDGNIGAWGVCIFFGGP